MSWLSNRVTARTRPNPQCTNQSKTFWMNYAIGPNNRYAVSVQKYYGIVARPYPWLLATPCW